MNYTKVQEGLKNFNDIEVDIYISYLKKIESEKDKTTQQLKNKWFAYFTDEQAMSIYKKVSVDDLFIDGETITLQFKGSVTVSYNYQAYKNKLLKIYPETLFDIQNVYEGDIFDFRKENGKVFYSHKIIDPFGDIKKIIGCYCIIKNKRGEFIETLNKTEISKMRNVAKTQAIWNVWEGEMTLKSVIKRACKRHFNDVIVNIEIIDNENYVLENVSIDSEISNEIEMAISLEDLGLVYDKYKESEKIDEPTFIKLLTAKKIELKKTIKYENS
jgi:hypothetical protein